MKMRVFEKLVGTEYEPILIYKLKKGDRFRISEGSKIVGEYIASSDPYKKKDDEGDSIWTINGDDVE